jgi:hypothetical protein
MSLDPSIALPSHVWDEAAALAGTLDHGSDHEAIIEVCEEDSWDWAVDNGVPMDKKERIAWAERKNIRQVTVCQGFVAYPYPKLKSGAPGSSMAYS